MNITRPKPALPAEDFRSRSNIYYPSSNELPTCVVCSTQLIDRGLVPNSMKVWRLPVNCEYGAKGDAVWSCWSCQWDAEQSWKSDYLVTVTMVYRMHDMYTAEDARSSNEWEASRGSYGRPVTVNIIKVEKEEKDND